MTYQVLVVNFGNQTFATMMLPFWKFNFKLFMKKQKTQKEILTTPPFLPKRFRQRNLLQEEDFSVFVPFKPNSNEVG